MKPRFRFVILMVLLVVSAIGSALVTHALEAHPRNRIFVLVVWDGLRPDFVTQQYTPNLFAMARGGVRFDRHHSVYPTLTMVNAAALSTGAPPGISGLVGNVMYLEPLLGSKNLSGGILPDVSKLIEHPVRLESEPLLEDLDAPRAFNGHLLGLDTVAQEAAREGAYVAIAGKDGPTFLWDDRLGVSANDAVGKPPKNYLFASDELMGPQPELKDAADKLRSISDTDVGSSRRDDFFTGIIADKAIPAARAASDQGHPAIIVLWLREPDWAQHRAGLGTLQDIEALQGCDANLGRIRKAIEQNGIASRTDLMVVSDHGFATIRMMINLNGLLVAAGIKKSLDSTDIVVAPDASSDFIYLSPKDFPTGESRREVLQRIVNFAEAQEWCGPIFSREPAPPQGGRRRHSVDYLGWIDGTFSEASVGIYNQVRSPDLVISFREYPDADNSALTGPRHPAFALDAKGQHAVPNLSRELVRPVKGVTYADTTSSKLQWTTGMGMHGAAGPRELHNFCAAIGPDFRGRFVDRNPTGNADVAATITRILNLEPNVGPGGAYATGRALEEALSDGEGSPGPAHTVRMTTDLQLQGMKVVTTLTATQVRSWRYLDDSSVEHIPLGRSP